MLMILTDAPPIPDHIPATNDRHPAAVYTVRDVAARLRCSGQHVLDLIGREHLRAVREGNRWLVLPHDLDAYLAGLKTPTPPAPKPLPVEITRERARRKAGTA